MRSSSLLNVQKYNEMNDKKPMPPHHKLFDFSVNGTRYHSEHKILTGLQIKQIASVPADDFLFLVHPNGREELVADHKTINFTRPGVEKFVSRRNAEEIMILVNTTPKPFDKKTISYEEVVSLAGFAASGHNKGYTVSYTNGPACCPSGNLLPRESIQVQNMMRFTVSGTVVS